jgi:hypothetical protein
VRSAKLSPFGLQELNLDALVAEGLDDGTDVTSLQAVVGQSF